MTRRLTRRVQSEPGEPRGLSRTLRPCRLNDQGGSVPTSPASAGGRRGGGQAARGHPATGGGLTGQGPTHHADLGQRRPNPPPPGPAQPLPQRTHQAQRFRSTQRLFVPRGAPSDPARRRCAATGRESGQTAAQCEFAPRAPPPPHPHTPHPHPRAEAATNPEFLQGV